jgi:CO/xanthine dehydrogenase Mo-binding subunit
VLLQCRAAELDIEEGQLTFRDGRATDLTIGGIACAVGPAALFEGDAALETSYVYEAQQLLTSGFSVHIAKIRLDPRTGFFRVLDYLVTHDAGRALNRMIVDGRSSRGGRRHRRRALLRDGL